MTLGEAVGAKATHAAAGATIYFGLTLNDIGVIVGIAVSLAMWGTNAYFQWRRDRREEREMQRKVRGR